MFWLWVCAGCAASAVAGFSLVRYAAPTLPKFRAVDPESIAVWGEMPGASAESEPLYAVATAVREAPAQPLIELPPEPPDAEPVTAPRPRSAPAKRRAAAPRMPAPTAPQPPAAKLILWARQVKAGERKMSVATDGCRVTWDRTCKHGHPTWLVRLGYLKRPRTPLKRHTPR